MTKSALPRPNATYRQPGSASNLDESSVKGIICNPFYAGIGPFTQIVSDEAWIKAASQFINEEGSEQFLVNLLHILRETMDPNQPEEELSPEAEAQNIPPFQSDYLYCSHDSLPMIQIDGEYSCIGEYLFAHLFAAPVTDLIATPQLTLVFQNGHTMPLLCPDCGKSLHIDNEDSLLNSLNGLSIIDINWDDEDETVILDFGISPQNPDDPEAYEDIESIETLEVHLNSIRGITCPHQH